MKTGFCSIAALALAAFASIGHTQTPVLDYPLARRVEHVDEYHGVEVADPYRWMEEMDSEETRAWMEAEAELLERFLSEVPAHAAILERIHELGELGSAYGVPVRGGDRFFFNRVEPGQDQPVVFVSERLGEEDRVLIDGNTYFEDPELRLSGFTASPDGRFLAFRVTRGQSRWGILRIIDVDSGHELPDRLETLGSATVAWGELGGRQGFFYVGYGNYEDLEAGRSEPLAEIHYHEVGTPQSADELVYSRPDEPSWLYGPAVTEDGRYLIVHVFDGGVAGNRVLYKDLMRRGAELEEIPTERGATYSFLGSVGTRFWFYTDQDAPHGRIMNLDIDIDEPGLARWVQVVPEGEGGGIMAGGSTVGGNAMSLTGGKLVALYREDVRGVLRVFDLEGNLEHERLLDIGWIGSGFVGRQSESEIRFSLNTFTRATTVYSFDLESKELSPIFERDLRIDPDDFVTEQVFYKSEDGTRVPMFIAYKKGLERDGSHPVYMYGYGYASWVAVPWYQAQMLTWIELGGIYAMPGIRGGGEYGEEWHQSGIRLKRQNAIDDFIAGAEWLIEQGYTSPALMVANGGSASGSLAAAAILQRPDLFGAGMINRPSLDMLRYDKVSTFKGWTRGFGSAEDPEEFEVLYSYSPLHIIEPDVCYPPIMVMAGERDQVTPPLHTYKFVATLQANRECRNPFLLKIVWGAGHSFGTTREQREETFADQLAFLVRVLGLAEADRNSSADSN